MTGERYPFARKSIEVMKVCVLGAGVIGVSTAYALGRLGHDVFVIDKAVDVAMGASFANGAQLSYSYIDPLASPSTLKKVPSYLLGIDKALQLRFMPKLDYLRWGISFLRNCSYSRFASNRAERQALAEMSREALKSFESETPHGFKTTGRGKLVLAQSTAEYDLVKMDEAFISPDSCRELEPALKTWNGPILGGLYAEDDFALDTIRYCKTLKALAEEKFGVKYFFDETIVSISPNKLDVKTDRQLHEADKVIVCLGNEAQSLLEPLGVRLPIYAGQGYSLTLNTKSTSPTVSVTDLKNKIVYANLGDKFRIAGFVDVNQRPEKYESRLDLLMQIAQQTWPDAADFDGPIEKWTGARPMMPSGVPVIGESTVDGLYLNLGHGSLGYTFAAGSAMKIANIIGHKHNSVGQGKS